MLPDAEVVEQTVDPGAAAPTIPGAVASPETTPEEGETPAIPKPRFDEVLTRAKAAEQKNLELEARVRSLESKPATPQGQVTPTLTDVLAAYDKGQITETMKDQWVHYLSKEDAKREFGGVVLQAATASKAQATVADYVKAYPMLRDPASPEFHALSHTYAELLMEGSVDGLATQAKALRMTFGPVKGPAAGSGPPAARPDTFVEASGGGVRMPQETDPLKDVPERQKAYWKSKGYSKAQMIEEAKHYAVRSLKDYRQVVGRKKK